VCVNVFESGVYLCAGCRSGDRIQEINRREVLRLGVRCSPFFPCETAIRYEQAMGGMRLIR
jgi:hypothetical protein